MWLSNEFEFNFTNQVKNGWDEKLKEKCLLTEIVQILQSIPYLLSGNANSIHFLLFLKIDCTICNTYFYILNDITALKWLKTTLNWCIMKSKFSFAGTLAIFHRPDLIKFWCSDHFSLFKNSSIWEYGGLTE